MTEYLQPVSSSRNTRPIRRAQILFPAARILPQFKNTVFKRSRDIRLSIHSPLNNMVLRAPKIFTEFISTGSPNVPATKEHVLQSPKDIRDDLSRQKKNPRSKCLGMSFGISLWLYTPTILLADFELKKIGEKHYIRSGGHGGNEAARIEDGSSSLSARHG